MIRNRSRRYIPALADCLESRVVPSHASAQVAIAATSSNTTASTLQSKLAAAGTQINAAYSTFATTIRQQELAAFPITTTTAALPLATAEANIVTATYGLTYAVETALSSVPGAASKAAAIGQGIDGGAPGSLFAQMIALFNAASDQSMVMSGPVPVNAMPFLDASDKAIFYTAVEGAITSSLQATGVQGYLAAVTGSTVSSTAATNLTAIAGLVNPAYSALGTTLSGLFGEFDSNPITPTITADAAVSSGLTPFETVLDTGVATLSQTLVTGLASTPAKPVAGLLQGQLTAALPGSLTTRFDQLFSVANIETFASEYEAGNRPIDLALIRTAYQVALDASYSSIGVEGYLIGGYGVASA